MCVIAHSHGWMHNHTHWNCACTCTHTQTHTNPSPSPNPLGKQSPASAAKLPKLSHPLMGYLSPCKSASLSTLMSFCCLSVCLCAFLNVWCLVFMYATCFVCLFLTVPAVWWLLFSSCLSACWLIMQLVCFLFSFFFVVLYDCFVEEFVLSMYTSFKGNLFMYFLWSC